MISDLQKGSGWFMRLIMGEMSGCLAADIVSYCFCCCLNRFVDIITIIIIIILLLYIIAFNIYNHNNNNDKNHYIVAIYHCFCCCLNRFLDIYNYNNNKHYISSLYIIVFAAASTGSLLCGCGVDDENDKDDDDLSLTTMTKTATTMTTIDRWGKYW